MNNLISIVTGFYCETKAISFIVVTDISHHPVFPHKHRYPWAEEDFYWGIIAWILIKHVNWKVQQTDMTVVNSICSQKLALASRTF